MAITRKLFPFDDVIILKQSNTSAKTALREHRSCERYITLMRDMIKSIFYEGINLWAAQWHFRNHAIIYSPKYLGFARRTRRGLNQSDRQAENSTRFINLEMVAIFPLHNTLGIILCRFYFDSIWFYHACNKCYSAVLTLLTLIKTQAWNIFWLNYDYCLSICVSYIIKLGTRV